MEYMDTLYRHRARRFQTIELKEEACNYKESLSEIRKIIAVRARHS